MRTRSHSQYNWLIRRAVATSLALALPATAAFAQAPAAASPVVLETVMVTAQRRSEDLLEVPVSITAVGGEKLDVLGSGGEDIRFLSGRLPSLLIESSFGRTFPRFYIRGLGNTDFDLNASQPVSLVYDDVVQENPILKGFPVFDLDMVEMFRGPQGTLFGRNTPAGVIKFNSKRPSRDADGYVRLSYGTLGTANLEGAVGGPLGDNMAVRLSGLYQRRDDWVNNGFTGASDQYEGYDEYAARVQFLYDAGSGFSALLNAHVRSLDGTARVFRANIFQPGSNSLVAGFDPDVAFLDGLNSQEVDSHGGSLRLRWDFGRTALHSITGYESAEMLSRGDIDGGHVYTYDFFPGTNIGPPLTGARFDSESADGLPDHSQFTQEIRLESLEWGRFDWQAGLFYFDESIEIDSFNYWTAGGPENGRAHQKQDNTAWAVFASMDFDVTDEFKLSAGLRYTDDEKKFVAERPSSPFGAPPLAPVRVSPSDEDLSWDLSGTWTVTDELNVFARVARGFRAPSIQGRVLFGDVVSVADSETVLSFEAGVKSELFDGRGRMSFTVFSYTMDDQQLTAVGGSNNFNTLINADKTKGKGFEFDLEAYLTERLLVTLGMSYNDTEIDDPGLAVAYCGSPGPGHCTLLDPAGSVAGTVIIDGNRLPQAPEWIANVTARYARPLADGELFFYTDWAYRSDVNFFLYEAAEFTGKSLLEGGLRVGYNWNDDRYQVSAFGRNITDTLRAVGAIDFNNLTGFINEPRTWGVEFRANF